MGRSGPAPTPPLLLLAGLALLGAARAAAGGGFSLHPPYFNLAEGARIAASATCGEEGSARGAPRPTEDLYCKLVGGPVAGGDPNQTIQVSARRGQGRRPGDPRARGEPASGSATPARLGGERPGCTEAPRIPPRLSGSTFRGAKGTPARPFRRASEPRVRVGTRGGGGRRRGAGAQSLAAASPGIQARRGLVASACCPRRGGGPPRLPAGQAGTCWRRDGTGMGGSDQTGGFHGPQQRVEAAPTGGRGTEWGPQGGGALRTAGVLTGDADGERARGSVCAPRAAQSVGYRLPGEIGFQPLQTRWGAMPPPAGACRWGMGSAARHVDTSSGMQGC